MGRIGDAVPDGAVVGTDAPVFIYFLEDGPERGPVLRGFFEDLARGSVRAVTSILTLMEVSVRPLQLDLPAVAHAYAAFLFTYPNLQVLNVDRGIARRAAELRARYRLRPADSIQVATGLRVGAAAFLTNDRALARMTEIPVLLVDDFRENLAMELDALGTGPKSLTPNP